LLRQPLLLGYLVAGMVVGPSVPGLYASTERVHLVKDLGLTVLVFAIGLEFDLRRLIRLAPTAGVVSLIQFAVMVGLGYLVGHLMGWTPWDSLLTGAIVSISGLVIIAKAFEETRVDPRVRELVFGVVLCEDVIAILLMAALITIANAGAVSLRGLSIDAVLLSLFIVVLIGIGSITVPYIVHRVAELKRPETLLILSLGLCFAFAMIAERAGYSLVLGAFLAGSLVAESGHGPEIEKLIEPVRQVFGAIFFVAVGMLIDPHLLARYWALLAVLVAVVVVGKIVSVSIGSIAIGERPDTALKSGFAMAQIGVFSILIAEVGSGATDTRSSLYTLAVGITATTAFLCPFLIRASTPAANWLDRHLPLKVRSTLSRYDAWLKRPEARENGLHGREPEEQKTGGL
jgi:CPA2 family monovalent cation:H+ antiporter-2